MKYTLILPIVALALLAFVTPDATAEPCSAYEADIRSARWTLTRAEETLSLAEEKQRNHKILDHFLSASSQPPVCLPCLENYVAINQAKAAVTAAEKVHKDAEAARDTCLESHLCDGCGKSTTSGTHVRRICPGCNVIHWSCSSAGRNTHVQVTCGTIVHYSPSYRTWPGCGKKYWLCMGSSGHGLNWGGSTRACTGASAILGGSGSGSGGGGGGSGSGTGNGDSSSRVRCANAGPARRHCDQGGWASSAYAHYSATCNAHRRGPVTYWSCDPTARRYHARHQ